MNIVCLVKKKLLHLKYYLLYCVLSVNLTALIY